MRIRYHGSITSEHGLGYVVDYHADGWHFGTWTLKMDSGHTLMYARRESFTILDNDLDNQVLKLTLAPQLDSC